MLGTARPPRGRHPSPSTAAAGRSIPGWHCPARPRSAHANSSACRPRNPLGLRKPIAVSDQLPAAGRAHHLGRCSIRWRLAARL